jgi:hypothetical protein
MERIYSLVQLGMFLKLWLPEVSCGSIHGRRSEAEAILLDSHRWYAPWNGRTFERS